MSGKQQTDVIKYLKRWAVLAVGVLIAAHTSGGIGYDSWGALVVAVLILSLLNVFLKPVLMIFALPFIVLTLGLGIWLINGLLFLFVGNMVPGFEVMSYFSALWGAAVISFTSFIADLWLGPQITGKTRSGPRVHVRMNRGFTRSQASGPEPTVREKVDKARRLPRKDDPDVIDI